MEVIPGPCGRSSHWRTPRDLSSSHFEWLEDNVSSIAVAMSRV